jgi:hypothetical protein
MDENENISNFLSKIKELKDKLGDTSEKISSIDLVIVKLSGMLDEYQIFITGLATRDKYHLFDDLIGILLQEEEQRKNLNNGFQSSNLALMSKSKNSYKGNPWESIFGGKSNVKMHQGGASPSTDTSVKKNNSCYYCGNLGNYAKDCRKKKFHEFKYRRHASIFVDREATIVIISKISSHFFQFQIYQ